MAVNTKLELSAKSPLTSNADILVIPVHQGELKATSPRESLAALLSALGRALTGAAAKEAFDGRAGQRLLVNALDKLPADRVMLVGLGEEGKGAIQALHDGIGEAARAARSSGGTSLAVDLPKLEEEAARVAGAAAEAALLGGYRFDRYISDQPDNPKRPPLKKVVLHCAKVDKALRDEVKIAEAVAEAVCMARDLVNEPPGVATPAALSAFARSLAKKHGLSCKIRGATEIERLRMGMFRAVSLGADTEPQFITLEYRPSKKTRSKGIAIVGKGITFDSGGYDLKPPAGMDGMKMDMGGAATALAAMRAVAAIAPPFPVTCYVGACENLVSGRAFKPGDVLKSRKGITVEVNNTDAEGRLVLGDLLTWATEQGHESIIDLATLTGACMIALGPYTVGAFSNDDDLVEKVLASSKEAGEDIWRLPLNQALREQLKSDIADTKNTGERTGGAITAALFLSSFVGETPWVHLDIAGPAMYGKDKGAIPKGASGIGVRTLARLIRKA